MEVGESVNRRIRVQHNIAYEYFKTIPDETDILVWKCLRTQSLKIRPFIDEADGKTGDLILRLCK